MVDACHQFPKRANATRDEPRLRFPSPNGNRKQQQTEESKREDGRFRDLIVDSIHALSVDGWRVEEYLGVRKGPIGYDAEEQLVSIW